MNKTEILNIINNIQSFDDFIQTKNDYDLFHLIELLEDHDIHKIDKTIVQNIIQYIMSLANNNDICTMQLLGYFYHKGYTPSNSNNADIIPDYEQAYNWYSKCLETNEQNNIGYQHDIGYQHALNMTALMYIDGNYFEKNIDKALALLHQSVQLENKSAFIYLGYLYQTIDQFDKAIEYFKEVEDEFIVKNLLGAIYYHLKDYEKAMLYLEQSLEAGYSESALVLSCIYRDDEEDYDKMKEYLQIAIDDSNINAMIGLGSYYESIDENFDETVSLYEKVVELGDKRGYTLLGRLYYGYKNDKALEYLMLNTDNCESQYYIAQIYYRKKQYDEALQWFLKSAAQNFNTAQYKLSRLYLNGKIVEQDTQKCYEYQIKAANNNFAQAQYDLAVRYENGIGIKQDYLQAVKWYIKALDNGFEIIHPTLTLHTKICRLINSKSDYIHTIYNLIIKNEELEEQNKELQQNYENLKMHVDAMPGGPLMLESHEEFKQMQINL